MKYEAIFFDMDGTVIDSLQDIVDAVNLTMRKFDLPEHTPERLRSCVGNGARRLIEQAVPEGTAQVFLDEIMAFYLPYYTAHSCVKTKPYEGIVPMLKELKARGLLLAIISNKPDSSVRLLAEGFFPGLLSLAAGERGGIRRKPWPDMIDRAAGQLKVSKEKCLYVGDSEVDIATARNAGIDCVAVTWGFRSREELERSGATVIIDHPKELIRYIET